jgi:hypothetical protein
MKTYSAMRLFGSALVCCFVYSGVLASSAWAQNTSGTVTVTVLDPGGALVPNTQLALKDLATNDVRSGVTRADGTYSFVNLTYGTYGLTALLSGFQTAVIDSITVQTARTTDVTVTLQIGSTSERIEVTGGVTPIVEATSSVIGTTIDMKQIEDLPLGGRDLNGLSALVPGYAEGNGYHSWNGAPMASQGNNFDGVVADTSRFKDFGNAASAILPRPEAIAEMTILTDQLDLDQGFGTSVMQVNFTTRRGTNAFHGRVYDDFQNDGLNANSWFNDAIGQPKGKLIIDDFGATLGGPIIKNKLFFFGDYAERKIPGTNYPNNNVLSAGAQQGNFTYTDTNGQLRTINVLNLAGASGLPSTVNSGIASILGRINSSASSGILRQTGNDPNLLTLYWTQPNPTTVYFPVVRVDYNPSDSLRFSGSWAMTKTSAPTAITPSFPGSAFKDTAGGTGNRYYTAALGVEWTISPNLINQFKGGFLYYFQYGGLNAPPTNVEQPRTLFSYPGGNFWMSGGAFTEPQSNFYPRFNFSDTVTWQRGSHNLKFGASWYREQDHYWNPPIGYPWVSLGLANGDPAFNAFTNGPAGTLPNASPNQLGEAEQLYAILAGRVSAVGGNNALDIKTKQYVQYGAPNLDELQQAFGLFAQDSWHLKSNLTVNFGLRWDFTGDDHDLNGMYHGVASAADLYGPSGYGNEFAPGVLTGNMNPQFVTLGHQYRPWHVSPQPAIGIAWSPGAKGSLLGKLFGKDQTVIRAGYSLRNYTPSYQNFWSYASNYGAFFEGAYNLNPYGTGPGSFTPGSLSFGQPFPPYVYTPPSYVQTAPESINSFIGGSLAGINPNIQQPYVQSWNFGIQRQLGNSNAIEVRYVGTKSLHQWVGLNINEVNIFENGFLKQFKAAQANLNINQAHGIASFANNGYAGQQPLPLFDAAFAGEQPGGNGVPLGDYANGNFIQLLQQGQAGALAQAFAGGAGPQYFCNLVGGNNFSPCAAQGFTGPGAGDPINFFQANPFQTGGGVGYLNSVGYSNYNGLQVEFRQKQWHGMQFNVNYTWSHALGLTGGNGQPGANQDDNGLPIYTMRDLRLNYGPMPFNIPQVVHALGTYDLPFGNGRPLLNRKGWIDRVVGGWTLGTIFTFQTGSPFYVAGGFSTFNNIADGGVVLNGITPSQLQNAVSFHSSGNPYAYMFNPATFVAPSGLASSTYFTPNGTPGTLAPTVWLYGPHSISTDMSLTKRVTIHENLRFSLQGEFLNAFNHPVWGNPNANVQSPGFGTSGVANGPRAIELRANVEF